MSKVILITGCSTGIGRDLVGRLAGSKYQVVATARNPESLSDLNVALKLPIDVTRPDSIDSAVKCVLDRLGRIDVLVNNAGYAVRGAIEETLDKDVRDMFDVNVFGVMCMVRAVAPIMRRQKSGRIINVSSIAGRRSTPSNGPYSASKFAVEALSDALRHELAPFGIQVVVIEPGSVKTQFLATADMHAPGLVSTLTSPYWNLYLQSEQFSASMQASGSGPDAMSRVIIQAVAAGRPKARYLVSIPFSGRLVLRLGDSFWDYVLTRMFKPVAPTASE